MICLFLRKAKKCLLFPYFSPFYPLFFLTEHAIATQSIANENATTNKQNNPHFYNIFFLFSIPFKNKSNTKKRASVHTSKQTLNAYMVYVYNTFFKNCPV